MDPFEKYATYEELDREPTGQEAAEYTDEVREWGKFGEDGGTLSISDFEDARGR